MTDRLRACFVKERSAFVAYVTCGDSTLDATLENVRKLIDLGVDVIELGVPFSDPVADGPTIQAASERALSRGVELKDVFSVAKQIRSYNSDVGLVLMGYANPFFIYGIEKAAQHSQQAGVDAWIVPDVPFEESDRFSEHLSANQASFIPLLAPTTPVGRAVEIVTKMQPPFVYYVSVTGVTGERKTFSDDWYLPLEQIRQKIDAPVVVGFGISGAASAKEAARHADGIVVGSALVRRIGDGEDITQIVQEIRDAI